MSCSQQETMSRMRLVKAAVIVLAVFLAVPVIDALAHASNKEPISAESPIGIEARALIGADDVFATVERIEEVARSSNVIDDEVLAREIDGIAGAHDIRTSNSGEVLGYVVDADCEEAAKLLDAHMLQRGWSSISLNGITGATYVKDDGECRWALATCTQVGSTTSVVIRVKKEKEQG